MRKSFLGSTGLLVSRLCYGTLTLCPSQSGKNPVEGGELIAYALEKGVNFLDTAQLYGTYPHIREALKRVCTKPVISTKSYAYDKAGAAKSFETARREMDIENIDIFMLHEQESVLTMIGHSDALRYYISQKEKGLIKAVGLSTHAIEPVRALAYAHGARIKNVIPPDLTKEFDAGLFREIDVVHPIINNTGLGISDGNILEMEDAVKAASHSGVGVLGMKIFGGGNLLNEFETALEYALSLDFVHSFAVGMQSREEIDINIDIFGGKKLSPEVIDKVKNKKRRIIVESWCTGCGSCISKCKSGAISLAQSKAVIDNSKCVLCSYCARACRDFAIKVV